MLLVCVALVSASRLEQEFRVFSADSAHQQVFAYKQDIACIVDHANGSLSVRFQEVGTFVRTAPIEIRTSAFPTRYRVDACFDVDGVSNLLVRDLFTNTTIHVAGQEEYRLTLRYDLLRYDYTDESAYVFSNGTLERYDTRRLLKGYATPFSTQRFTLPFEDVLVVNGRIFVLFRRTLYEYQREADCPVIDRATDDMFLFQLFTKKSIIDLAELPLMLSYVFQFAILAFLVYCLRYRLTIRSPTATYELSRPVNKV